MPIRWCLKLATSYWALAQSGSGYWLLATGLGLGLCWTMALATGYWAWALAQCGFWLWLLAIGLWLSVATGFGYWL